MMSVGLSSLPAIFLIASSSRILSYVMSIAIDEGPLDTMPNMSPSCTSSFEIFWKSCRIRTVLWNCRCRSSTKNRKIRPDTSFRGRLTGRMMPSGGGGGGGASTLFTRPPVTTVIDVMSCLTPSSKISNSSFLRSGTKLPLSSRTTTSLVTRSTCILKVGFSGCAGAAGLAWAGVWPLCAGVWADSPAARTTRSAMDQKPFLFKVIGLNYTSRHLEPGLSSPDSNTHYQKCNHEVTKTRSTHEEPKGFLRGFVSSWPKNVATEDLRFVCSAVGCHSSDALLVRIALKFRFRLRFRFR